MYSYPHHIGDFIRDTARLSDSQAMTYLRLIWMYYDTESPLPKDPEKLAFMLGACPRDTQLILGHFFYEDGDFYRHKRCDAEIDAYRNRQDHGRKAAKARWENAQSMPGVSIEHARRTKKHANREPITDNQEKTISRQAAVICPEGVEEQVWKDFLSTRKAKITETAVKGILREAQKAGWTLQAALQECTIRGWRGFKADWVAGKGMVETPVRWNSSVQGIMDKGKELGVVYQQGETIGQYEERIKENLKGVTA